MKIKFDSSKFNALEKMMGATHVDWKPDDAHTHDFFIKFELQEGIQIDLDEVIKDSNGVYTYKGHQVLIYIQDTQHDKFTVLNNPDKTKRFHFTDCGTIEHMKSNNRYEKYIATNSTTGLFKVHVYENIGSRNKISIEAKLLVCKNCLNKIAYKGYGVHKKKSERNKIVEEFSVEEFFSEYTHSIKKIPNGTDITSPIDDYPKNWKEISDTRKKQENYMCQDCNVNLYNYKKLLHTHHVNGVKSDISKKNLRVLCADCHSMQPLHRQLLTPDESNLIQRLRKEQGLTLF